jgi:hypothetical protein
MNAAADWRDQVISLLSEDAMARPLLFALATLALAVSPAHAEDADVPIQPAAKSAFDQRMFGAAVGNDKLYACFVRRYDADHLARHPRQKVRAMKLLVTAEKPEEDGISPYSFRLGLSYRDRKGAYDSSGYCSHARVERSAGDLRFGCGVDCDGGGIEIALGHNDSAAMVSVERVRIWQNNKPDDDASGDLVGGADDRLFRLDRTDPRDCASLVTDRKELAALRRKR